MRNVFRERAISNFRAIVNFSFLYLYLSIWNYFYIISKPDTKIENKQQKLKLTSVT